MAETFSKQILKIVVGQLCQAIGWNAIASSALDLMTDVLHRYIESMGRQIHAYSEQFGRTEPNLIDVSLTYLDMGLNLSELEEYIKNVDSIPCVHEVPKYPIPKESHLNFLKPGSREVVTRPVHVHEHLPPMHPEMEEEDYVSKQTPLSVDTNTAAGSTSPLGSPKANVFKRPGDPISSLENPSMKRARLMMEEEGRPLREISSVMMTTSGFLSPAREGKLPESRTPLQPSDSRSNSPQPSSYPTVPPEVKGEKKLKKIPFKKMVDGTLKKIDKENKKKELKANKEMQLKLEKVVPPSGDDSKVKKLVSMKELSKLKALKSGAMKMMSHAGPAPVAGPSTVHKQPKASTPKTPSVKPPNTNPTKSFKPITQIKIPKIEKTQTVSPPSQAAQKTNSPQDRSKDNAIVEGKLSAEPDKQKLNIFKKISKVKDEKVEKSERSDSTDLPPRDSRDSSPGLVIDESELSNRQREIRMAQIDDCIDAVIQRSLAMDDEPKDVKPSIEVIDVDEDTISVKGENIGMGTNAHHADSDQDVYMFDDDLYPPGTPSTPRTPELPASLLKHQQEPKEKKKKRDRTKSKKEPKVKSPKSTKKTKSELKVETLPERPKTPECPEPRNPLTAPPVFPFFPSFPPAPGLIPPPIPSMYPLFPRFSPMPIGKNLPHPAMPNLPLPPPTFMQQARPALEIVEVREKPIPVPSQPPLPVPVIPPTPKVEKEKETDKVLTPSPTQKLLEKKLHKKEKKDKDKLKKKNRKDKMKAKEKLEKKRLKIEKKERLKEKLREKKEKREKKKEKEKEKELMREEKPDVAVPKITLRIGPASPRPPTPDAQPRKIWNDRVVGGQRHGEPWDIGSDSLPPAPSASVIKPIVKKPEDVSSEKSHPALPGGSSERQSSSKQREPSPELARISALIRGPPKPKSSSKIPSSVSKEAPHRQEVVVPPLFTQPIAITTTTSSSSVFSTPTPSGNNNPAPTPSPISTLLAASKFHKKALNNTLPKFKPKHSNPVQVKKDGGDVAEADVQPAAAERVAFYYDQEGNKVWICPACGGQDDGSPMIGCDDCDAWYHWVCVGIQVPPDENEDWYCRVCIVRKKQENTTLDKKKKPRKRKIMT